MSFNYFFSTRLEAEEVLDKMYEICDCYGIVFQADFYDLIGQDCRYTDNKYGWVKNDIKAATVKRVVDKYMLTLRKPVHMDGLHVPSKKDIVSVSEQSTSGVINVTVHSIHIDDMDAFAEVIKSIMTNAPDRVINFYID